MGTIYHGIEGMELVSQDVKWNKDDTEGSETKYHMYTGWEICNQGGKFKKYGQKFDGIGLVASEQDINKNVSDRICIGFHVPCKENYTWCSLVMPYVPLLLTWFNFNPSMDK